MVDEFRFPPIYTTKEVREWSERELKAINWLSKHGVEFKHHYVGSTACSPSRATIFTGQYPSLHGVSQTDGAAKTAYDPDIFWLDPQTVPTLGEYLEVAGYQTYYKGKWHISEADILIPTTHNPLPSYNPDTGVPDPKTEVSLSPELCSGEISQSCALAQKNTISQVIVWTHSLDRP